MAHPTFNDFYNTYGKKKAPKQAAAAWARLSKKDQLEVMEHLPDRLKAEKSWPEFQPYPATFLNQRRWMDHYDKVGEDPKTVVRDTTNAVDNPVQKLQGLRQFRERCYNNGQPTNVLDEQINKLKRSIDEKAIA